MAVEKVEVLVVGAGQAGVAMSEHLGRPGAHLCWSGTASPNAGGLALGFARRQRPGLARPVSRLDFSGDPDAFARKDASPTISWPMPARSRRRSAAVSR